MTSPAVDRDRGLDRHGDQVEHGDAVHGKRSDVFDRAWKALVANGELVAAQADKWKLAKK